MNKSMLYQAGIRVTERLGTIRGQEYDVSLPMFEGCQRILDVGCGTGTFCAIDPQRIEGIDINPDNVAYCRERGLNVQVGNALEIPHPDQSFDGVYCSHLMQVFLPEQAAQLVREMTRVCKPDGVVVIATLNWFRRFFRHPENVKAYPPDAIRVLFSRQRGASSPMFPNMPHWEQESIWLRRPALVELHHPRNHDANRVCGVLNRLQYVTGLRKYWTYDAYIAKYRNCQAA